MQEAVAPQLLPHNTFPCDKHASHASNNLRERLQTLSHLLSEGRSGTQSSSVLPLRRLIDFGSVEAEGGGSPGEEQTAVQATDCASGIVICFYYYIFVHELLSTPPEVSRNVVGGDMLQALRQSDDHFTAMSVVVCQELPADNRY